MDYHAWMILERSLGILDYGNVFNTAAANPAKNNGLAAVISRVWSRLQIRFKNGKKGMDARAGMQKDTQCHTC